MPSSKVSKKKMFREFSKLNQRYVKSNYLKRLRTTMMSFCGKRDIFEREMSFMLWCYDLEFFTIKYAAKDYEYSEKKLAERLVYPLVNEGYLYREETKYNYRVRYALTQKARLLVQAFYRELEV